MMALGLLVMAYILIFRPHEWVTDFRHELVNELWLLLVMYWLVCLLLAADETQNAVFGWCMVGQIIVCMLANVATVSLWTYREIKVRIRGYMIRRKK